MNLDDDLCWPHTALAPAAAALAAQAGLGERHELAAVSTSVPEVPALLRRAAPALLSFHDGHAPRLVALLRARGDTLHLLGPDGRVHRRPAALLRDGLCARHEIPLAPEVNGVLDAAGIAPRQRDAARRALLAERLAAQPVAGVRLLRAPAGAPVSDAARELRLPRRAALLLALLAGGYALELAGWRLIGDAALDGRLDTGWLAAWVLMLLTLVPLHALSGWVGARLTQDAAQWFKQRLLAGAMRLDLDTLRREGAGQWLARLFEAQALEAQSLGGALTLGIALLELAFAAWVLWQGAAPLWHAALLLAWLLVIGLLCTRLHGRLAVWTATRLALTERLVEDMVGHRTRLAQERPARRDAAEDRLQHDYLRHANRYDAATVPLVAVAPGGWLLLGLAGLAPALAHGAGTAALAISLGGVLFAHRALGAVSGGIAALVRARVAWHQVAPLVRAGAQPEEPAAVALPPADTAGGALVDASALHFRHGPALPPVLQGADLRLAEGERVLLQGASGSGKSTLAALLTGLRQPDTGLLLLQGLDRHTLGTAWHRRATGAPQFGDNHVFAGTLVFNLLLGHAEGVTPAAVAEAEALCRELGLGELLDRMPGGTQQRVGETGWQLSHGERSRLFLARALLQRAPLTVLDESFAALDPPTLKLCLETAQRRTRALVVIAHP